MQARSPALDLDSLYGTDPGDPRSEHLYRDRGPFLVTGRTRAAPRLGLGPFEDRDLLRWGDLRGWSASAGPTARRSSPTRATTTTSRRADAPGVRALPQPRRRARDRPRCPARRAVAQGPGHRHAPLPVGGVGRPAPRICDAGVLDTVWNEGRRVVDKDAEPGTPGGCRSSSPWPRSGSATRWCAATTLEPARLADGPDLFRHTGRSGDLPGHAAHEPVRRGLPPALPGPRHPRPHDPGPADRHDLAGPRQLPLGSLGARGPVDDDIERNLAFRNLARARAIGLASGQEMHAFLHSCGVDVPLLDRTLLTKDPGTGHSTGLESAWASRGSRTRRCGSTSCARRS